MVVAHETRHIPDVDRRWRPGLALAQRHEDLIASVQARVPAGGRHAQDDNDLHTELKVMDNDDTSCSSSRLRG